MTKGKQDVPMKDLLYEDEREELPQKRRITMRIVLQQVETWKGTAIYEVEAKSVEEAIEMVKNEEVSMKEFRPDNWVSTDEEVEV
jgi:hypothetical protein